MRGNTLFKYLISIYIVATMTLCAFAHSSSKLEIIYPKYAFSKIDAVGSFFIGNTTPGSKLTINGESTKVYGNGSFVKVIGLREGLNIFEIKAISSSGQSKKLVYKIQTPKKEKTISRLPLKFNLDSITPNENLILKEGDTLKIRFQASTGHKASFMIGKAKHITMHERPALFIDGQLLRGFYEGSYTIKDTDNFINEPIKVQIQSKYATLTKSAKGRLTIINSKRNIITAEVITEKATVRAWPYGKRLTPIPKGSIITITGKDGSFFRFTKTKDKNHWIKASEIKILPAGSFIANVKIKNIKVEQHGNYSYIKIPMGNHLPFEIQQKEGHLKLEFYGAHAGLNPILYKNKKTFIREIKTKQLQNNTFKLEVIINGKNFWGYDYYYDKEDFVLKIRNRPKIDKTQPLKGRTIAIDAGHGGSELGAIGPTNVSEKVINLKLAQYIKQELEAKGAKVIMTRTDNNTKVPLQARTDIAKKSNVEILISLHNNALPDGKNPYKDHGTSTYYYHCQAMPLAKSIQDSLIRNLRLKNLGIEKQSFVLTRPSEQLSVLVEIAFMIHPDEYALLLQDTFQKKASRSVRVGIEDFLKNSN